MNLIYLLCIFLTMLEEPTSLKRYALPEAEYYSCAGGLYPSHTLAQYARWLIENKYTTEANGLPGNDDYGIC